MLLLDIGLQTTTKPTVLDLMVKGLKVEVLDLGPYCQ